MVQSDGRIIDPTKLVDVARLSAIGPWRYTQGVYVFDPGLQAELTDTPLTGDIPAEVLLRLPQWSIYIHTSGMHYYTAELYGYWVHLEWDAANNGRIELRLLLDTEAGLIQMPVHLGPWSLAEAINRVSNEAAKQAMINWHKAALRTPEDECRLAEQLQPLITLILYICSDEPDLSGLDGVRPHRAEAKRTKRGWRLFPAAKPTIWRVGESIGKIIRGGATLIRDGKSPRSHIRRAHWHGYWVGGDNDKRFKYRWLAAILISGRDPKEGGDE